MTQGIAIYDLDRTLTRRGTWSPFLLHALAVRAPWRLALLPIVGGAALLRQLRLVERDTVKQVMHATMLGALTPGEARALAASFARRIVPRQLRRGALARIAADRAAGYRIVVATAAYHFYAEAIADALGVVDVVATGAATGPGGRLLPRIAGLNCYGAEKQRRLAAWLAAEGIAREGAHLRFYSDHVSDAPCFAWADEAFAVHPHRSLRRLAVARGWPVLDWR